MPKYKPTEWLLTECRQCNYIRTDVWYQCKRDNHTIVERPNVPFRVPDMRVIEIGSRWTHLASDKMNKKFHLHRSKISDLVLKCGVAKGGALPPNQWWMYNNQYGQLGLKWLGSDTEE